MNTQHLHLTLADPVGHLLDARLTLSLSAPQTLTLMLPRWIPGSYLLRDFARHLQDLRASDHQGHALPLERTGLGRWQLQAPAGEVRIDYRVYAFDASVRSCLFTPAYAFLNPAACALVVEDWRDDAYELTLAPVEHPTINAPWQVHTTLPTVDTDVRGFGHYRSDTYDQLIDHPLLIGDGVILDWESAGIAHRMVLVDERPPQLLDVARLTQDLNAICTSQHQFWRGQPLFSRYLFQVMVTPSGYGGLEHSDSTALMTSRNSLPSSGRTDSKAYEDFLGLCSHEYFHAWMVKRIRPQVFHRPNLQEAVLTPLLWIFEGFTSLYDDWFLYRSGRIGCDALLARWSDTFSRTLAQGGGAHQSLSDASIEAWIKFYQPHEHSPNSSVSYYTRGAATAFVLLAELVRHERHLDELLSLWWQGWQQHPEVGMTSESLLADLHTLVPDNDWHGWLATHVNQPNSQLLTQLIEACHTLGLQVQQLEGGTLKAGGQPNLPVDLGMRLAEEGNRLLIKQVRLASPAHSAGLQVGDELLGVEGERLTQLSQLENWLQRHCARLDETSPPLALTLSRQDHLIKRQLIPAPMALGWQLQQVVSLEAQPQGYWINPPCPSGTGDGSTRPLSLHTQRRRQRRTGHSLASS